MTETLIVVDNDCPLLDSHAGNNVISFDTYLHDYPKLHQPHVRIINLCDTRQYLGEGYYCSLLAEARNHAILPDIKTINEIRDSVQIILDEKNCTKEGYLWLKGESFSEPVYFFFGQSSHAALNKFAKYVYMHYPAPVLKVSKGEVSSLIKVEQVAFDQLSAAQQQQLIEALQYHEYMRWNAKKHHKKYRWDMAILVNPEEKYPPSNKGAISLFIKAAEKLNIKAKLVSADELLTLGYYDALFVRETTAIDHHTYRLVRQAELQGLVVIDDSASILRCCNKVFLHDAFTYNHVPSLKTMIISRSDPKVVQKIEENFSYPVVLKMPEGAFSTGVYKVHSQEDLVEKLDHIFHKSTLTLVQEYMFTDFDWRIGVINGRALYACKYYMARNHWQIYHHTSTKSSAGKFDCLPTFEVPRNVLNAALRACKMIGKGFYGVDIKVKDGHAYVIEVNDNPSIDRGVEDQYLGEELYMQIMSEFLKQLESRGK
ncbi:RimK family protein [Facilibium subflavum]|uniref:RimK family protein n=1 Tax=Facilibium subflavum TaxID=2219058 RepID=UPI000E6575BC|nr:RimK family protein [Facilibium subflavum]